MIWLHEVNVEKLNLFSKNSMGEFLGIQLTEIGEDYLCASMPVNNRTKQPYGILHGGASVVLAESVGSVASGCVIDITKFRCVGLEINSNHIRSVKDGIVYAKATAVHLGKTTHIWDIRITDEHQKLVNISRLTVAIIPYS